MEGAATAVSDREKVWLLTVPEVARGLHLSLSKTWALIYAGEIESVLVGRARRVPAAAVDAYIERLRAAS